MLEKQCDTIVYLGDFFDRCDINAEEATALKRIEWNNLNHHFIIGNHEANTWQLLYTPVDVLNRDNFIIEHEVAKYELDTKTDLYILPYIREDMRKPLTEYLEGFDPSRKNIILSHNDIKGVQYGRFLSEEGFPLTDIERNCDLFINGHIHNLGFLNQRKSILNLGIICGKDFNENAFEHEHCVCIVDTDTLSLDLIENPCGFNFYKLDITSSLDMVRLENLKNNAVVSVRCLDTLLDQVKEKITNLPNIVESRLVIYRDQTPANMEGEEKIIDLSNSNYLDQFTGFIRGHLGEGPVVMHELSEICR